MISVGTYQIRGYEKVFEMLNYALTAGYRLIGTNIHFIWCAIIGVESVCMQFHLMPV